MKVIIPLARAEANQKVTFRESWHSVEMHFNEWVKLGRPVKISVDIEMIE
jgi:hypothetical protein